MLGYLLDQFCEGVFCGLLRRNQTSDKTVRSRTTDAQKYCTLLLRAIDVVGREVVFQALRVSCPLFCTVVELSHVPVSCHLIPTSSPICRKGSLLELTDGNTLNTDGWGTMQGDANEHFPHWTTRQDTTNQQQTLQKQQ